MLALFAVVIKKQVDYIRAARARQFAAYIVSEDIVPTHDCTWRKILRGRHDASFLAWLGLTVENFFGLVRSARSYFPANRRSYAYSISGRPALLDYVDVVAITLRWLHGVSDMVGIHTSFGISKATAFRALDLGIRCLLETLRHHPLAIVCWPSFEQIANYALQILNKGARADFRRDRWPRGLRCIPFAWIDGSVFSIPKPYHYLRQSRFYSCKHKMHCVNCVFVFAPDSLILYYKINAPVSFHDLKVADSFVIDFLQRLPLGMAFLVMSDSARHSSRRTSSLFSRKTTSFGRGSATRAPQPGNGGQRK